MAHSKQALKRIRTNDKSRQANKSTRSAMRTAVKKAAKTAQPEDLGKAMKNLDKAAKKGVIHRNAAARKKSRLARAANKKAAASS
jgi:small subunit ribosomal protein S20